jgi:predicted transcriptional regulator
MGFLLTVKIDPRMKAALKKVADKQFISISAAAKQAIEKYLESHGADWRKEATLKRTRKKT